MLVAVTARHLEAGPQAFLGRGYGSPAAYADALGRAGAQAVLLPPVPIAPGEAPARLAPFAGLVLTGGGDVDPDHFGAPPEPETYGVDRLTDDFELALLRSARAARLPVLAICRGAQLLNVALGGTLYQHLPAWAGLLAHGWPTDRRGILHMVSIEAGSRLAEALGTTRTEVVSIHHQGIATVGHGLEVSARSDDGLVEAIEPVEPAEQVEQTEPAGAGAPVHGWLLGVQWHPEESAATDPVQQGLFDRFVDACRARPPRLDRA